MEVESRTYTCGRCDTEFPATDDHTEIVRRDFVEVPRPSRIDRLCEDCWAAFVGEFLDRDFEAVRADYGAEAPSRAEST